MKDRVVATDVDFRRFPEALTRDELRGLFPKARYFVGDAPPVGLRVVYYGKHATVVGLVSQTIEQRPHCGTCSCQLEVSLGPNHGWFRIRWDDGQGERSDAPGEPIEEVAFPPAIEVIE